MRLTLDLGHRPQLVAWACARFARPKRAGCVPTSQATSIGTSSSASLVKVHAAFDIARINTPKFHVDPAREYDIIQQNFQILTRPLLLYPSCSKAPTCLLATICWFHPLAPFYMQVVSASEKQPCLSTLIHKLPFQAPKGSAL